MTKILCSAVWYDDGIVRIHQPPNIASGIVVCGLRHCNCFQILRELFPNGEFVHGPERRCIEGFLTNKGEFANREEAYKIADAAGQIVPAQHPGRLHSEDVWV